ncbi:OmpA family protein [Cognatitamlana onchidii]|uniref:OmpA family protein n=1 Tax=Cognatitamlana onchidii TaxID=2562860 RepID=UPI0010A6146C|nr:OmpA family protein [Algibacter onchidii]
MKLKIYLIILCSISFGFSAFSQMGKIKSVTKKYNNLQYDESKETLLNLAYRPNASSDIIEKLANVYYFNGEMEDASKWYEELLSSREEREEVDSLKAENYFRYVHALKAQEKYNEADKLMEDFVAANPEDLRSKSFSNHSNYLRDINKVSKTFDLKSLKVNTAFSDFGVSTHNGKLIFASSRDTDEKLYGWNGQPFLNLFSIDSLNKVEELSEDINSKYHESSAAYSRDGKTLYFTRNNYYKGKFKKSSKNAHVLQIFRADLVNGEWTNIKPLPFNSKEYNVAHPALSIDEKKLYFSSDMPGSFGSSDLYVVDINDDGTFGTPVNLGNKINTEGRENFPFISDKDILYFASDGHVGLGGLDVFKIDVKAIGASEVKNVGRPINSPKDDFGYVIYEDTGQGYVSSNRIGGQGDDDIYSFTVPECKPILEGIAIDKYSKEVLANANIVLYDEDKNVLVSLKTNEAGLFIYNLDCLKQTYLIEGRKDGYYDNFIDFTIVSNVSQTSHVTVELEAIPAPVGTDLSELLSLNPIYYDFDKAIIRKDAKGELTKVIGYMDRFPTVKVDIRSHTDSRGTKKYNIGLSNKRNERTKNYLIKHGNISPERLTGKGYGESQLTNHCKDGVYCTRKEHQANRRSEFIIIEN